MFFCVAGADVSIICLPAKWISSPANSELLPAKISFNLPNAFVYLPN
ncbi:hypothetical protein [Bacillus sp. OK048]|nr:hypothetical protein [Bacillus sp. OK048]